MKDIVYVTADMSHELDLAAQFAHLAEITAQEPHLLSQTTESLREQFELGLSILALRENVLIGHATLWFLTEKPEPFYEVGTTWVAESWRGKGVNTEMYVRLFAKHRDKNILGTTTNRVSLRVGVHLDMVVVSRRSLPENVWGASCVCSAKKMGADNSETCSRAWTEVQCNGSPCVFRVTRETATRYRLPKVPFPE